MAVTRYAVRCFVLCAVLACGCKPRSQTVLDWTWQAPGAPAQTYTVQGTGPAALVGSSASEPLATAIEATARTAGSHLTGDGRLALGAAFCAEQLAAEPRTPAEPLALEVARHLGSVDPELRVLVIEVPRDALTAPLAQALGNELADHSYTHYGAALLGRGDSSLLVIVLAARALTMLQPVTRAPATGAELRLHGRLAPDHDNPRIAIRRSGSSDTVVAAGVGAEVDIVLPAQPRGVVEIELLVDDRIGTKVVARLPLHVGLPLPREIQLPAGTRMLDTAALTRDLFARLNAERARAGVEALQLHPVLAELATRHGKDMRDHGFLGHESLRTGGPAARVERAGLGGGLVLEHIVSGADITALLQRSLAVPAQRAILVHPDVTHVGVGVVDAPTTNGSALLATLLFMRQTEVIDPQIAEANVLSALNQRRTKLGVAALARDAELTKIARGAAAAFLNDSSASEQRVIDDANQQMRRFSSTYSRVAAVLALVQRVSDAGELAIGLDAEARHAGVGVARGLRPDRGGEVLVVVVIVAVPRTPGSAPGGTPDAPP